MKRFCKFMFSIGLLEYAALLALHFMMIRWLGEKEIASTILAAGNHVPKPLMLVAGFFLFLRLMLFLILPGAILSRLGMLAFDHWLKRDHRDPHSP